MASISGLARAHRSATRMTKVVLPNHTNSAGLAYGGWLLKQLDIAAFNAAQRHHRGAAPPVTVSIDNVQFLNQIKAGQVLTCEARVTRAFGSSLEIEIEMIGEDPSEPSWQAWPVLHSHATFVTMGADGRSARAAAFEPKTEAEHAAFIAAGERREIRLRRRKSAVAPAGDEPSFVLGANTCEGEVSLRCSGRDESPRHGASYVEMTESLFSKHTNARGTAFGGQLLAWSGVACSISAARFSGMGGMVLAASDEVAFLRPVEMGDTVVVGSEVTGSWQHSLEVAFSVEREDPGSGVREQCLNGFFTYVSPSDAAGRRLLLAAPTDEDAERSALRGADRRRARRVARRI